MVGVFIVGEDVLPRKGTYILRLPQDWPPHGLSLPEGLQEEVVNQVIGGILNHLYLLKNDPSLPLDLLLGKAGVYNDIREKINPHRKVLAEELYIETGILQAREGINHPAYRLHLSGNINGVPPLCPLEEEVLNEVREPSLTTIFMA